MRLRRAPSTILLFLATSSLAQDQSRRVHEFLRNDIAYTDEDLAQLESGKAVTKAMPTEESREVAISGAVHIYASTDFFLRMYEDIERFDTAALAIKKISDPPKREDFTAIALPEKELAALKDCRPDSCNMKLGKETMDLLAAIDWSNPDATRMAQDLIRERVYVGTMAYVENGSAALSVYRDKKQPGFVVDEFKALLDASPYILAYRPELHDYLVNYPHAKLERARDFLYWSIYDYGKPVLRVSHATIYPLEGGAHASAIVTGKQLFFSHFFMAGLELHVLARDMRNSKEAFYLVSLIRMRTDGVGGMFGGVLKNKIQNDVLDNMQRYMDSTKAAIERYYRARRR